MRAIAKVSGFAEYIKRGALDVARLIADNVGGISGSMRVGALADACNLECTPHNWGNGSGDGPGSERGLEYDTMSGKFAEFVEAEVLPLVEKQYNVKLTKDPEGRATMGGSSGGSVAMAMAWFHPELYHRVLTYSGTYVNNQWPVNPELPHGAWELHERLIPNSPVKPLRVWMEVGDRDNGGTGDVMHDWVVANENMAKVLAAKGYHYQFSFAP